MIKLQIPHNDVVQFWQGLYGPEHAGNLDDEGWLPLYPDMREGMRRLARLGQYLKSERPKVHCQFNFRHVTDHAKAGQDREPTILPGCGTAGCALGELPGCFPRSWYIRDGNVMHQQHTNTGQVGGIVGAGLFFHLTLQEARHLFLPYRQATCLYGGVDLTNDATPDLVGDNMLAFVARKRLRGPLNTRIGGNRRVALSRVSQATRPVFQNSLDALQRFHALHAAHRKTLEQPAP